MSGKEITVGGRAFTLYPVPAVGLKAIGANFVQIGNLSDIGIDALTDAVFYGVKRGALDDATVTRDFFAWNIDATNVEELTIAVAEVNNATRTEVPSGEA